MKTITYFLTFLLLAFQSLGQTWQEKDSISTTKRAAGVGFVIEGKAYIGSGLNENASSLTDFWEFDPSDISNGYDADGQPMGKWSAIADVNNNDIWAAVGLTINGKGYVITGGNGFGNSTRQVYEYDPANNWWTEKQYFEGTARIYATGFTIGSKGYIGTGYDNQNDLNPFKDFWEYDPTDISNGLDFRGNPMGKWTQKADFEGIARAGAVGFVIGEKGYVGTGENGAGWRKDFWEYDPADTSNGFDTNGNPMGKWTQKADAGDVPRSFGVGFAIDGKGYIGTGEYAHLLFQDDFWEYDPTDMSNGVDANGNPNGNWVQSTGFSGVPRRNAIGLVVNGNAYIGTGYDDGYNIIQSGGDFWELYLTPTVNAIPSAYGNGTIESANYPNPFRSQTVITTSQAPAGTINVVIYNSNGQVVRKEQAASSTNVFVDRGNLNSGIYFYQLMQDQKVLGKGKLIIK